MAKTWLLPEEIALAVRLHHDFTVLEDQSLPLIVRQLVAMLLITEHLVAVHEGVAPLKEWLQHGQACLEMLHVEAHEVTVWSDALHSQFEGEAG